MYQPDVAPTAEVAPEGTIRPAGDPPAAVPPISSAQPVAAPPAAPAEPEAPVQTLETRPVAWIGIRASPPPPDECHPAFGLITRALDDLCYAGDLAP